MDTTQLVRQHQSIEYTPLSRGHIAGVVELVAGKPKQKAAVTAFTDLLLIVLPGASAEALYGPCKWGAIHGTQFPAVGAEVQVGVDETNHPVVLWWAGEQKEPAAIKELEEKVKTLEETRILAKGIGEFEWPGASQTSNEATIAIGTTVPVTALVMMQPIKEPAIATTMITVFVSKTATEFKMFAFDPEGSPGKAKNKFNWMVVKN